MGVDDCCVFDGLCSDLFVNEVCVLVDKGVCGLVV